MTLENEIKKGEKLRKELLDSGYKEYGPYDRSDIVRGIDYVLCVANIGAEEIRIVKRDILDPESFDDRHYIVFTKGVSDFPDLHNWVSWY